MDKNLKSSLKEVLVPEQLFQILQEVNYDNLTSSDVHLIDKQVERICKSPEIKIAYLGNYTIEPLPVYVNALAALENITIGKYIGGYSQYFQEVLQPSSELKKYEPDVIYLALSIRQLYPELYNGFLGLSVGTIKDRFNQIISHLSDWVNIALKNTSATIILSNFLRPDYNSAGIADIHQEYGESEFYFELNLELLRLFRNELRVHVFDLDRLSSRFGKDRVHNPKMYYLAKMEWHERFLPVIAGEIIRYLKAIRNTAKKCLVLDLDNTLWGGIVGEDGPLGIKVGQSDPVSEAYLQFQHKILSIKNRGVILAICSKNNLEDVLEVFEKRSEMPLKKSDFSVMEINWNTKDKNIRQIAAKLNISTDSIVFIDDNPAECSLVNQMLPEVQTILLPRDPVVYLRLLDQLNGFEKLQILQDDLQKTTQYLQNQKREEAKIQIGDLKTYLESLSTEICILEATEDDLPRVYQLFTKTNQFNLTTIRYSTAEIEQFIKNTNYVLTIISAKDKFGTLGVISVYLLQLSHQGIELHSFIMSCRAMGRGIETAIINQIKRQYLIGQKNLQLLSTYIPTAKNKPVENFFEDQGFDLVMKDATGKKEYILSTDNAKLIDCSWIKIKTDN